MVLSLIELQRARRQLRTFCERRSGSPEAAAWSVFESDGRFELSVDKSPVLRVQFDGATWHLSVPRADGTWMAYPPRPHADSFAMVMDELELAPLHVHW